MGEKGHPRGAAGGPIVILHRYGFAKEAIKEAGCWDSYGHPRIVRPGRMPDPGASPGVSSVHEPSPRVLLLKACKRHTETVCREARCEA